MKEFEKLLSQIAQRHSLMQVFDDFLTLTLCAFGMGRYEDKYFKTLEIYSEKEKNLFPKLLGELVNYYTNSSLDGQWVDGLGEFFMEYSGRFGKEALGQFFTPEPLCKLMAELLEQPKGEISDCAVGSGRCLIAADRTNPNNRFIPIKSWHEP